MTLIRRNKLEQFAAAAVESLRQAHGERRWMLGVDGYYAAGKTTLASVLADHLTSTGHNVLQLGTDDFMRLSRAQRRLAPGRYVDHSQWYDLDRTEAILRAARANTDGTLELIGLYNHATGELDAERRIILNGIGAVILEGMYAVHEQLRAHLDLALLVVAEHEVLLRRAIVRDRVERNLDEQAVRERYWSINGDTYQRHEWACRPYVDLVLDNSSGDFHIRSAATLIGRRICGQIATHPFRLASKML